MVLRKHTTSQWGLNFFGPNGSNLFGVEHQYMTQVAYREMFHLVGYGFDYQSLRKMPIALRRYYYRMWVDQKTEENKRTPQTPQTVNYDPAKKT